MREKKQKNNLTHNPDQDHILSTGQNPADPILIPA